MDTDQAHIHREHGNKFPLLLATFRHEVHRIDFATFCVSICRLIDTFADSATFINDMRQMLRVSNTDSRFGGHWTCIPQFTGYGRFKIEVPACDIQRLDIEPLATESVEHHGEQEKPFPRLLRSMFEDEITKRPQYGAQSSYLLPAVAVAGDYLLPLDSYDDSNTLVLVCRPQAFQAKRNFKIIGLASHCEKTASNERRTGSWRPRHTCDIFLSHRDLIKMVAASFYGLDLLEAVDHRLDRCSEVQFSLPVDSYG